MSASSAILTAARNRALPSRSLAWVLVETTERLVAFAALAALSPLLLLIAAVIAVLSRRAPLVAHRRVGYNDEPFWVVKFRTMWDGESRSEGAPRLIEYLVDENGPNHKRSSDPRVRHGFARLLRRHSVDELPQLIHVLSGRMSLVGPRPLTRTELDEHYGRHARTILRARPGLTGLWQVMGRSRLSYPQRVRLDLFYVEKRSIALYLSVLARTVPQVIAGQNSW